MALFKKEKELPLTESTQAQIIALLDKIDEIYSTRLSITETYIERNYKAKNSSELKEKYVDDSVEVRAMAIEASSLCNALFINPEYTGKRIKRSPINELTIEPVLMKKYDYNDIFNLLKNQYGFGKNKTIKKKIKSIEKTRFQLIKKREKIKVDQLY